MTPQSLELGPAGVGRSSLPLRAVLRGVGILAAPGPLRTKRLVLAGRILGRLDQDGRAAELLDQGALSHPEVLFRRAWALERSGDVLGAAGLLRQVLEERPEHRASRLILARLLASDGRRFDAYIAAEALLRSGSEIGEELLHVARYARRAGDHHEAARLLRSIDRSHPLQPDLRLALASSLAKAPQLDTYEQLRLAELERTSEAVLSELLLFTQKTEANAAQARVLTCWVESEGRVEDHIALAHQLAQSQHTTEAVDVWESLMCGYPDHAPRDWVLSFADALRSLPLSGIGYDKRLGLSERQTGDLHRAESVLERSLLNRSPSDPHLLAALGSVRFDKRDLLGAVEALAQACAHEDARSDWFDLLGQCHQHPLVADQEAALRAYEAGLQKDSGSRGLAVRMHRVASRQQDWAAASRASHIRVAQQRRQARTDPEALNDLLRDMHSLLEHATAEEPSEVIGRLRAAALSSDSTGNVDDLFDLAIKKLLVDGFYTAGFDLKRRSAERTLARTDNKSFGRSVASLQAAASAAVYLGRTDLAADLVRPRRGSDSWSRRVLTKLAADAALVRGETETFEAYWQRERQTFPLQGDDKFSRIVTGKDVALVGPSEVVDVQGQSIDQHETVVRIRYLPAFLEQHASEIGSRVDASYYSGHDFSSLRGELAEPIRAGLVKQVVARPMMYGVATPDDHAADWLRFARSEYSLYFRSAPLGIQRALYDLAQFSPAKITLYNVDFYSGSSKFIPGYRSAGDETMSRGSLLADVFSSHDLLADFQFTRALFLAGVIDGDDRARRLLSLSNDEYIAVLESIGRFA